MNTVHRDREWILREYGAEKWPTLLADIERVVAGGEGVLSRVIALVESRRRRGLPWAVASSAPHRVVASGREVAIPYAAAFEGYAGLLSDLVIQACTQRTGAIIELGSGIGYNLCRVWLTGGPRSIPYYALELTAAGRRCSDRLSALEPDFRLRSAPFDYESPDYSLVAGPLEHVVVFTSQSIEQVPQLNPQVFEKLLGVARSLTCLHFEPIGWQLRPEPCVQSRYAQRHDYNRNLWSVLTDLRDEGRIVIESVEQDVFGIVPENSVTYVRWRNA